MWGRLHVGRRSGGCHTRQPPPPHPLWVSEPRHRRRQAGRGGEQWAERTSTAIHPSRTAYGMPRALPRGKHLGWAAALRVWNRPGSAMDPRGRTQGVTEACAAVAAARGERPVLWPGRGDRGPPLRVKSVAAHLIAPPAKGPGRAPEPRRPVDSSTSSWWVLHAPHASSRLLGTFPPQGYAGFITQRVLVCTADTSTHDVTSTHRRDEQAASYDTCA